MFKILFFSLQKYTENFFCKPLDKWFWIWYNGIPFAKNERVFVFC